jgi:predicted DsbA family dithiol-disulfide isomerase
MQMAINGVPFFVFDRRYAVSGAQDSAVFLGTLMQTLSEGMSDSAAPSSQKATGEACGPGGERD